MNDLDYTEHGRYFGNPTQIALFIIACILITFSFSSLTFIIYSIYHNDKQRKSHTLRRQKSLKHKFKSVKSVNYPTLLSATFYFLSTCSYITALYFFDDKDADNFGHEFHFVIAMVTFVAFIFAAKISIYAQFLARLYTSFKGSYLEPNSCVLKFCACILILSSLTIIWWIILLTVRYVILKKQFDGYYMQFYFVFSFLFLFDFTVSWFIVGLFTKNLFASMLLKDRSFAIETELGAIESDSKEDSIELSLNRRETIAEVAKNSIDGDDQRRLNLITKQVILSSVAIISSQLSYISLLIILIVKNSGGYEDHFQPKLYSLYAGAFYPLDVIINCVILYFNYKFADKYYKLVCNCCHNKCHNCVQTHATNKIERQLTRDQGYSPMHDI